MAGRRALRTHEQGVRRESGLSERSSDERRVVDDDASRRRRGRELVREAARDGHRRLGVVRLAQVLEHLHALVGAELLLERRENHAVPDLLAAVRPKRAAISAAAAITSFGV